MVIKNYFFIKDRLFLRDIRSSKQIKKYENFHFEDITQV